MIDFLKDLNPAQRDAVTHTTGPLLILAGAGSGKTRVLTYRIAYLIGVKGIRPDSILAVTFTNKAAGEMKERVEKLLGPVGSGVWVSTFHSWCARILRAEAHLLGYTKNFSIYDDDDQMSLLKKCMEELDISPQKVSPDAVQNRISSAKDKLITWQDFSSQTKDYFEENVAKLYKLYQNKLSQANAFDFDDLIMQVVEIFTQHPEVLRKYQDRYQYILVDEYQDTNHAQYRLVNLLAAKSRNLCVVGDEDQSIYGWRGADINNILDFEKDYPEAKIVKLEQNYRSTQVILDAASAVVKNNLQRKGKTLYTRMPGGEKVSLWFLESEYQEAEAIVGHLQHLIQQDAYSRSDFTILYRTNAQSRVLEQKLRDSSIPYVIVGGVRFYERKEVKDILAYLKVLANPRDDLSLKRIINVPARGIGAQTISRLENYSLKNNLGLMEGVHHVQDIEGISPRLKNAIKEFSGMLTEFSRLKDQLPLDQFTEQIAEKTGYLDVLRKEKTIESENRMENVKELVNATAEFRERSDNPTLEGFLEEVSLITDIDLWDKSKDAVTLMTLHAAKGLEFRVVFIAGLEEGLFPLSRSLENPSELEEERRLFYVGITRAKERLYLSCARNRRRFADMINLKSRFLDEIPGELLQIEGYIRDDKERFSDDADSDHIKCFTFDSDHPYDSMLKIGATVLHSQWGEGVILDREGSGENLIVVVIFRNGIKKKLMAKYACLEIIS
jgi:DNA helicase-2/ATP-dependent DNA helicase PcrA